MKRMAAGAAAFCVLALLFPIANRGAYLHFRPLGHGWFALLARGADLSFPPYVAAVHSVHLVNVLLVVMLPAVLAAYEFWLGSRETTATDSRSGQDWSHVPRARSSSSELVGHVSRLVRAVSSWLLSQETGRRRWLRLAPFFSVSLWFGIQALAGHQAEYTAFRMELPPAALAALARKILAVHWRAGELPASYIRMNRETPAWQLVDGWHERDGSFRWTLPVARTVLARPAGARQFELAINAGPPYPAAVNHAEFIRRGWQTVRFDPVGSFGFAPPGGGSPR